MFASPTGADASGFSPTFAVARFDPESWTWDRLPDSDFTTSFAWFVAGNRAVNPTIGCQDDAPNGESGTCYPHGGIFDLTTESWSALPTDGTPSDGFTHAAIGRNTAQFDLVPTDDRDSAGIAVLDVATNAWYRLPWLDDPDSVQRQIVPVGIDAFVYGGLDYDDEQGNARGDSWILRTGRDPATHVEDGVDVVAQLRQHS